MSQSEAAAQTLLQRSSDKGSSQKEHCQTQRLSEQCQIEPWEGLGYFWRGPSLRFFWLLCFVEFLIEFNFFDTDSNLSSDLSLESKRQMTS